MRPGSSRWGRALADLTVRAGTMTGVALRIAAEVTKYDRTMYHGAAPEDRRMARRLRAWASQ